MSTRQKLPVVPMLFAARAPVGGQQRNRSRREEVAVVARVCRSIALVLALLTVAALSNVASPEWACGCRADVPDNPGSSVADERALIAWDGTTEDILMSLSVTGSAARAAWAMPVPSPARVSLGDPAVFEDLGRLTAPRIEYRGSWWPTIPWLV